MLDSGQSQASYMPLRAQHARESLRRIQELTGADLAMQARYKAAKMVVRAFRNPAFYEMSQRCNLFCEGCYFFENADRIIVDREMSNNEWNDFFAAEQKRGVSMAYFVGAEPALEKVRLRAAAGRIPHGNIGTNGTIRIEDDIPFRIQISIWGDDETDTMLRGGSILRKALSNYRDDPRVIMSMTLSPWNLNTVPDVLAACADHGLPVMFSLFSPTKTYLGKRARNAPVDNLYYRLGNTKGSPVFSSRDLSLAADQMSWAMDTFPDLVLCSPTYRDWITRPGPLYDIDEHTGVAINCGSRIVEPMHYYTTDGRQVPVKCCTPDVDCSQCRLFSGGWSTQFLPSAAFLESEETFGQWLDLIQLLGRLFVYEHVSAAPVGP